MKVRTLTGVLFGVLVLIMVQQLMLWRSMGDDAALAASPEVGSFVSTASCAVHAPSGRKLLQLLPPGELDLQAGPTTPSSSDMAARRLRQLETETLSNSTRAMEIETLANSTRSLRALELQSLENSTRALEVATLRNSTRGLRALELETLENSTRAMEVETLSNSTRGLRALELQTLDNSTRAMEVETLSNSSRGLRALEAETLHNSSTAMGSESTGRGLLEGEEEEEENRDDADNYKLLAYVLIGCRGAQPEPDPVAAAAAMKEETDRIPEYAAYAELRKKAIDEALAMVLETPITFYGCRRPALCLQERAWPSAEQQKDCGDRQRH